MPCSTPPSSITCCHCDDASMRTSAETVKDAGSVPKATVEDLLPLNSIGPVEA